MAHETARGRGRGRIIGDQGFKGLTIQRPDANVRLGHASSNKLVVTREIDAVYAIENSQ